MPGRFCFRTASATRCLSSVLWSDVWELHLAMIISWPTPLHHVSLRGLGCRFTLEAYFLRITSSDDHLFSGCTLAGAGTHLLALSPGFRGLTLQRCTLAGAGTHLLALSPGFRGLTLQRCTLAGAGTHLLARSLLLPATGARPRGHGVHQILLLSGSTGDVAHGAWRVLACHAAISRAVCQRLHHVVLIREGSLRPRATSSARRALTELAL